MRILPLALMTSAFVGLACFAACSSEELNPGSGPRATTPESGTDGATEGGGGDAAAGGSSCNSILTCIQGCKTTPCTQDCQKAASPKAQNLIGDLQSCSDGAKTAQCLKACTLDDGGVVDAGDAGDGGDAGVVDAGVPTGPQTAACTLCVLQACKGYIEECVNDK